MTNPTLATLLAHRSIRRFTAEKLTAEEITTLVTAAQHAPTSTFSQQYSILSVTDPAKLAVLGDITGHHWLEQAGHYFIFLVDQYRNQELVPKTPTTAANLHSTDKLLAGIFDATIATEAVVTAGESLGLGSTIMGSILNDVPRLIQLFELPELTFPVLGLAIGHPAEQPEHKPRLPQELMHFSNTYRPITAADSQVVAYDALLKHYYQQRTTNQREETFTHHLATELGRDPQQRAGILAALKQQGFLQD
ncbi:NADPH-dependent oxidoreductase [Levilactobacillus zymae]|uniref:NADPH-dependent oxidoreductase n=1 Tax=Levilactobacillus zymae TaxID=267363 RepID=A0ABQ0WVT0_9LACO|nr:nitroreductase family protein [Levilactobacillus zymae]KRL07561.1 nitroreductase [Levilactobacillus zymae DSM 19395]QFR62035.1 NADPH-dependent oxidoreductase [Levilactobacillus zymae]GEO71603.1 NADPH-dependent oxidoreductase [Levilactobacillus zymae]